MKYWPAKAPGEVLDYSFDFTAELAAGETISTRTVTATGITKDSDTLASPLVTAWLSGGALGTPGIVTCSIVTDQSRTFSETAIVPIGVEPVSLGMAKAQCRAEGTTADDGYFVELIQSAREHVEAYCGIRLMPAAVKMVFPCFAALERLAQAPIQSIVDVRYLDTAGAEQVLDASTYEFVNAGADPLRPKLRLAFNKSWPAFRSGIDDAVRVNAVAGYTVAPMPAIRAMLLLIGQWYDNRQTFAAGQITELPNSVQHLLANYRR